MRYGVVDATCGGVFGGEDRVTEGDPVRVGYEGGVEAKISLRGDEGALRCAEEIAK